MTFAELEGTYFMNGVLNKFTPPQVLLIGYVITVLTGAFLLSLPMATESGEPLPFVDALFTSTSAVCITGLIVVNTGSTFSTFGELVIMFLFQIGGLGIMTFASFFPLLTGKKIGIKERLILREAFNQTEMRGVVRLVLIVTGVSIVIELVGFLLLSLRFVPDFGWSKGLYYAMFHALSAFNSAGFDLFGPSLAGYVHDPYINMVVSILLILGGLGFIVIWELSLYRRTKKISLHTKLVLTMTGILIFTGMIVILLTEWSNPATLAAMPWEKKVLASFFHSVTPRSGGFSTLSIPEMHPATLFFVIHLMFIGAAPASTGGGIKVTTMATILLAVWSMVRGREHVVAFRRRIPYDQVYKALTITLVTLTFVILATMLLTITEQADILTAMFEATSAVATVGLSMGLTSELTTAGKLIVTVAMIAGRLGPMTIAYALAKSMRKPAFRYPEEKTLIS